MEITLKKAVELLMEKNIKVIEEENKIYIDPRVIPNVPIENHEGIELIEGIWSYCEFISERRDPIIRMIKQFSNQEEALKYLFLKQLHAYFMSEYVVPSRDYDIKYWTMNTVINDMGRLNIPGSYLSYEGNIHPNSILLSKENNKWFSGYINHDKELVFKTKNGTDDENWYLSLYGNVVYALYLFDLYIEELKNRHIDIGEVTDLERLIMLGYK